MTTGEKIRELRLKLGLSQKELATRLGLKDKTSVSKTESNATDMTTTRIKKYAKALNCSPMDLMGDFENLNNANTDLIAKISLNKDYQDMLKKFDSLSAENKRIVSLMIDSLCAKEKG